MIFLEQSIVPRMPLLTATSAVGL